MRADSIRRGFVYHSPQYPGFTSWCGLWTMPDDSVMCSLTQATGPFHGRQKAPAEVRTRLAWPPSHGAEFTDTDEAYDMTGLRLENLHLRSTDCGDTWEHVASDAFGSCMNGTTGEAETALPDGTILRGVWGPYLPYDEVPDDGYIQRSTDGGRTWGAPEVLNAAEGFLFWPKRIRVLGDGRVLAGGGLFRVGPDNDTRRGWFEDSTMALFASTDDGATWGEPIDVVPAAQKDEALGLSEEFDWAELAGGDLLLVMRADAAPGGPCRMQTRLVVEGDSWHPTRVEPAPFPHSGHPELLATREGVILHLATSGISGTGDGGATWTDLPLDDGLVPLRKERATGYYPKAVQMANGEVLVVGHVGGDNGYGVVDQSIVGLRFRLSS